MRKDVLSLVFMGFVVVYDLTVYSASIVPYIQSLVESDDQASLIYSIVISSAAFMQVTFASSCGYIARYITMKFVFLIFQFVGILGIIIYAFAGWPIGSVWAIVIGRALFGITAACFGLTLSYISTIATERGERAQLIANFRGVTILAAIPASIMALILALPFLEFSIGSYDFNAYTYPAWSSLILQIISMTLNAIFLQKVEVNQPKTHSELNASKPKRIYLSTGVFLILGICFFDGYFLSAITYALPVVMLETYEWTIVQYAPVMFGISVIGLLAVLTTKYLAKRLGEYFYVIIVPCLGYMAIMTVFLCIGAIGAGRLPTGVGETLFLFGAETAFGSFQIIQTSLSSIFSQVIPSAFIIRMMPLTSGTYALGKILGPLLCELQVAIAGIGMIFYTLLVLTAILMFVVIMLNKHLRNIDDDTLPTSLIISEDEEKTERVQ